MHAPDPFQRLAADHYDICTQSVILHCSLKTHINSKINLLRECTAIKSCRGKVVHLRVRNILSQKDLAKVAKTASDLKVAESRMTYLTCMRQVFATLRKPGRVPRHIRCNLSFPFLARQNCLILGCVGLFRGCRKSKPPAFSTLYAACVKVDAQWREGLTRVYMRRPDLPQRHALSLNVVNE